MSKIIVRYEPGSSGKFCASIVQSLISNWQGEIDPYGGGMHNTAKLPNVAETHDWIQDVINDHDFLVQIILDQNNRFELPQVCCHFYYCCIKRWWDTGLFQMYHPDLDKDDLLKILMQKHISANTLTAMVKHHSQYAYAFKKYPSKKIIPITLDCLLNGDPVQELVKHFPTDKNLDQLNTMVKNYQKKYKRYPIEKLMTL